MKLIEYVSSVVTWHLENAMEKHLSYKNQKQ